MAKGTAGCRALCRIYIVGEPKIGNLYHVPFENMVKVALESEKRIIEQNEKAKRETASDHK